ncbi:mitochondrial dynamin gtpase [Alternaria burnsii]|uniref:dynamin GTPase n=1 Tax=Alternaria burnsii TaxID=1187904 RepID=A0A8H7EK02_9PLEO|nr:mitochondrial dynamin gtpase [Alternaria burnsii]KAF7678562.1 mitochondrial dynamin gtpase [Alternaria burnsii]
MSFISPFGTSTSKPGHGSIVLEILPPNKPVLRTVSYQYPLKLVAPDPLAPPNYGTEVDHYTTTAVPCLIHTVFLLTYGGGIVAGDSIDLDVELDSSTRLILLTQGSTKIFKTPSPDLVSRQHMNIYLKQDSALVYLPDPVQPFAHTAFSQSQVYHLDKEQGNLCICDWVTSGRSARGENWDIYEYKSRNEVWTVGDAGKRRLLLRDNLILDKHGKTGMPLASRMDNYSVFGTLIIRGPIFSSVAKFFLDEFEALPRIGGRNWGDVVQPELQAHEQRRYERQQRERSDGLTSRGLFVVNMSGRLVAGRLSTIARRSPLLTPRFYTTHSLPAGGLLRNEAGLRLVKRRPWPLGSYALHNVPATRSISFARVIPKLVGKFATVGAAAGGAVVAGVSYIQYQAGQAGTFALDLFHRTKDGATEFAGGALSTANGFFDQLEKGFKSTKDEFEGVKAPEWLQRLLAKDESGGAGGDNGNGGGRGPENPKQGGAGTAAAGTSTAAAFGYSQEDDEDRPQAEKIARDDQMMMLTKKMIEIRGLLQTVGQSDSLTLPSIVVIGSQSSGKSSVLEAIVGHEFLPKGHNMVTRRPIELTLVNTPEAHAEYCEFPALGLGKVTDFSQVQKTLTDLNLAVPASDCVSDDPIQLRVYSPNVPDLSLIDLPGYIQVVGRDQPPQLKEKISQLCEKYIKAPNVILAISAADVDLANSTALRASRRMDPRGERTIGVITKMDLVDAERGASLLSDQKYALRLGYVGVVCRVPAGAGGSKLFSRGNGNITNAITKNEKAYFGSHPEFSEGSELAVGTQNLKKKLMHVLEQTMAGSLKTTSEAIQRELEDARYEFKVQYNERPISAESYLAESLDAFKHSFRGFTEQFGRQQVRDLLKHELDQQVLNLLAQRYWNRPFDDLSVPFPETDPLTNLAKADIDGEDQIWQIKLDSSSAALTKAGVGRLATNVVASALQAHIDRLITNSRFAAHPFARQAITDASTSILKDLSYDISDELEICIKPYKYRIEVEDNEWAKGRENVTAVLKDELKTVEAAVKQLEEQVGGRKRVRDVMSFIDRVRSGQVVLEGDGVGGAGGFSSALLAKGREAVFLRDRIDVLKLRLMAIKSKQCATKKNKYHCPEVFLDAVADKLTTTADLFLDAELLSKFYYIFPRELDARLGRGLSQEEIDRFAKEDPKIKRHLDVVRRKDLLEHVLKEMEGLRQLEQREKRMMGRGRDDRYERDERRKKGWSMF